MASLTVDQRAVGAVVGSIIADAAGASTHWIYEVSKLDEVLAAHPQPEFIEPTQCPFYKLPTGRNSCYGDQAFTVLQSLEACKGFDKDDYKKHVYQNFGPQSEYEGDLGHEPVHEDIPVNFPWRNGSLKHFITEYEAGKEETGMDDAQADGFAKVAPIVALYAGSADLETMVRDVVKVTQNNKLAIDAAVAAAELLEEYILHGPDSDTVKKVTDKLDSDIVPLIQAALEAKDKDNRQTAKEFGSSCALPGSFQCAVHALVTADDDFVTSTRATMTAGGDNCSRLCFVGAMMGARVGVDRLPAAWIDKASRGNDALTLARQLVSYRTAA